MAHIRETPQYQIYLKALETLKQRGYEIEELEDKKSMASHQIKKGSTLYGKIFVLKDPDTLFNRLFGDNGFVKLFRSFGSFETMVGACEAVRNSRYKSKVYWPDYSLVGAYTTGGFGFEYEDNWLKIVSSVIG